MRLYTTVLHLHRSPLSTPLGPVYECCGSKAVMANTAHADKIAQDAPMVHVLTAIVAHGRQVRRDQAGILSERIERL